MSCVQSVAIVTPKAWLKCDQFGFYFMQSFVVVVVVDFLPSNSVTCSSKPVSRQQKLMHTNRDKHKNLTQSIIAGNKFCYYLVYVTSKSMNQSVFSAPTKNLKKGYF